MKTIKVRRFSFRPNVALAHFAFAFALTTACATAATVHGATGAAAVWISTPESPPSPLPQPAEMRNTHRTFQPPFVVIPAGSSVRFPNDDPFFHSIYSDSPADPFDIGYYGTGPGKVVEFDKPAIVDVHCHIHASMHAAVVVVDGPYAVVDNGTYSIANVPPGKHTLHAWDPDRGERTQTVVVPNAAQDVTLDVR
jgi:plastocyanin